MVGANASTIAFTQDFSHTTRPDTLTLLLLSFTTLSASYYSLAPRYGTPKQTSWILTTVSSAVMTIASLPFLYDYFSYGGSVKHVRTLPMLSIAATRFFQTYLAVDLVLGSVHYPSQLQLVTGWIHHALYIIIVELTIKRSWTHIFCLCAAMEIPTFVLGFTNLYPHLRSNVFFAVSFFLTRILFHIILAISYLLPHNRHHTTGGSFLPAGLLAMIFPMHAMWFRGCIKGFQRRRAESRAAKAPPPSVIELDIYPEKNNLNESPAPLEFSTPSAKLRQKVYGSELHFNSVDARSGRTTKTSVVLTRIYGSIPPREVVYDYVGLGRLRSKQAQ
ncbi:uncharacterized protein LACBIDRAFT_304801 [Laccaria bicolor S238N-H82]|uniref:Predicted protein n=1 Tax=Laccaria bicolor (strain S238N-H82 / ATCC MYA-4686) TaxID=486041 RepID=B0DMD4_LACBS|nr:uncharacterized protein LACBIDRAFT_304801 [Laccaria bicolor S238N-H82]EDR04263.1 predicted protein [Laccaria bicolor S238N-H82]|eukprot:XP_001885154.1 predicted protein [Laccaria bicolor S238N-H82]